MTVGAFQTIGVNIVGQTYTHRSLPLSAQITMNLYPEAEITGRSEAALNSWPGSIPFATILGDDRGMTRFQDEVFKVAGTTLYKVDLVGAVTTIGTIAGSNRCIFANDGTNLIITTGGPGYQYNGTVLTEITDPDFEEGNSCAFLNNKMFFDGNGGRFQVADVGDPDSIEPENFATAETAPDDTIRVFAFNERVFMFGERTIEPWYDVGVGSPPVRRVDGATMNIGLDAIHSVTATDNFVYWLGSDKSIYRFSSHQAQSITSVAIANDIENFTISSDAIGFTINLEGQTFYAITFPDAAKTYVFNEDAQQWFNLSTGSELDRYIGNSHLFIYNKHLIASRISGDILELDLNTFTDNGMQIIRQRVTAPINGISIKRPGKRLLMGRFEVIMEMGVGLEMGQGQIPQMMFEASFDGGKSFTNPETVNIGRTGEGRIKAEWYHLESFYDCVVRVSVSDPVFISLHSAAIDIKEAGW